MAKRPEMWLRLKVDTHSYSSADRTPMSATPNTFKGMRNHRANEVIYELQALKHYYL